jgi:hypothetical protein
VVVEQPPGQGVDEEDRGQEQDDVERRAGGERGAEGADGRRQREQVARQVDVAVRIAPAEEAVGQIEVGVQRAALDQVPRADQVDALVRPGYLRERAPPCRLGDDGAEEQESDQREGGRAARRRRDRGRAQGRRLR